MFSKKSELAKKAYLALSLTTALVAAYQPNPAQAESFGSQIVDAVEANRAEQVTNLLNKGINPNERGEFGTSALLRAANNGNLEIAKILISKGANANVADLGGATALHIAARKGDFALTDFLLKNKADVNLADKEGNTPLMLAAIGGSQAVVDALIAQSADVDATNNSGETALLYATDNSAGKIVDALVAAGAKNDVVDAEGYSIKEVAQRKNNEVLVAKLDANDSNHVVIEMGRGFRSITSAEKERQEIALVERMRGEQLIASLDKRDLVDYSADYPVDSGDKVDFIDDPELAMLDTPNFAQIEPASGASVQPKTSWLAGLKKSFDAAGAFELASVKNFAEGSKYTILEMGSFKVKAFAEKRISELQMDNMDILGDVSLVIFERGTGANLEYLVHGGIFETRGEADGICQKLVTRGVRCNPVETAMITNDQFAKFNAPVKSEYSAPAVEAVKIPEIPKVAEAAPALPKLPPVATQIPALAKVEAKVAPAATPAQIKPEIATIKTIEKLPEAPKTEAKDDDLSLTARAGMADDSAAEKPKTEDSPSLISSIVDSIYSEKKAATITAKAPTPAPVPVVPITVKPEIAAKPVESVVAVKQQIESLPSLPVIPDAGGLKVAKAPDTAPEPMKIVFAESKPVEQPKIIAPVTKIPTLVASESNLPQGKKIAEFVIESNPATASELVNPAPTKVDVFPVLPVLTPAVVAPAPVAAPKIETAQAPKPTQKPAPMAKVVAETIAIPSLPETEVVAPTPAPITTPVPKIIASTPTDKFIVAKPIRVDDARAIAPAPQAQPLLAPAYDVTAAPIVAYDNTYTQPAFTLNRREMRRMVRVDYFATPTAAQGLYWKYRESGVLNPAITVRATRDLLNGVHYSALIGEFSTSAEAQAFCNRMYTIEKLRCTVQDEIDYTSSPRYSHGGSGGKSYQRHSSR